MNSKFTQIFALLGVLTLAVVVTGCGSNSEASSSNSISSSSSSNALSPMKVLVGTKKDAPPFEYEENGELKGFEIELFKAIAKDQNLQIEWQYMTFGAMIPALQAKQIDTAVTNMFMKEERKQVVDFSEPYFNNGVALVARKDGAINTKADLKGKTIAATQGSFNLELAQKMAEENGANVKILKDSPTIFLALETGDIDASISDTPITQYKIKMAGDNNKLKIVDPNLAGFDVGFPVTKGNKELLDRINKGLANVKASGEYQIIYNKYFSS